MSTAAGNWPGRSLLSPLLCTGDGDDPHEVPEQSVQCNREKVDTLPGSGLVG